MGLFSSLFQKRDDSKEEQTNNVQETTSTADVLLQTLLKSETINKNKALSIPAVSSAVDRISNLVAMLPVKLYKKEKDGDNK